MGSIVKNLTQKEIESIQIDEGVVILDYGEETERPFVPCRGGGEFSATATVRDIEFDGRNGKTAGVQVISEQAASLKVTTISLSWQNLAAAMPSSRIIQEQIHYPPEEPKTITTIKNPKTGVISKVNYFTNVTMFAKLIGGKYKKITIYKPMSEDGITFKAAPKAEGELEITFQAHYDTDDLDGDLWKIEEIDEFTMRRVVANSSNSESESSGSGSGGTT